jgi:hypothetical protein
MAHKLQDSMGTTTGPHLKSIAPTRGPSGLHQTRDPRQISINLIWPTSALFGLLGLNPFNNSIFNIVLGFMFSILSGAGRARTDDDGIMSSGL